MISPKILYWSILFCSDGRRLLETRETPRHIKQMKSIDMNKMATCHLVNGSDVVKMDALRQAHCMYFIIHLFFNILDLDVTLSNVMMMFIVSAWISKPVLNILVLCNVHV